MRNLPHVMTDAVPQLLKNEMRRDLLRKNEILRGTRLDVKEMSIWVALLLSMGPAGLGR